MMAILSLPQCDTLVQNERTDQIFELTADTHISASWRSYGLSIVSILDKINHVIETTLQGWF